MPRHLAPTLNDYEIDECVRAVTARAPYSSASLLRACTAKNVQSLGWPAVDSLICHVEWEVVEQPELQPIGKSIREITALQTLMPPVHTGLVLPSDRRFRDLCGDLEIISPDAHDNWQKYDIELIGMTVSGIDRIVTIEYDNGFQDAFPLTSARLMLRSDREILESGNATILKAWTKASIGDIQKTHDKLRGLIMSKW